MSDHRINLVLQIANLRSEAEHYKNKAREAENEYAEKYSKFKRGDKVKVVNKETKKILFGIIGFDRYEWPYYIKYDLKLTNKDFILYKRRHPISINAEHYLIEKI